MRELFVSLGETVYEVFEPFFRVHEAIGNFWEEVRSGAVSLLLRLVIAGALIGLGATWYWR